MTATSANAQDHQPKLTGSGTECATDILRAADAMHAELLKQVASLMGAEADTPQSAELVRLADIVETYEQARWPL